MEAGGSFLPVLQQKAQVPSSNFFTFLHIHAMKMIVPFMFSLGLGDIDAMQCMSSTATCSIKETQLVLWQARDKRKSSWNFPPHVKSSVRPLEYEQV
jgi:hypothetical protein